MAEAVATQVFTQTRGDMSVASYAYASDEELELTVTLTKPGTFDETQVVIRYRDGKVFFPTAEVLIAGLSLLAACIALKTTIALIKAIGQCLLAGKRSPRALLECLQEKGFDIGGDIIEAALECLTVKAFGA